MGKEITVNELDVIDVTAMGDREPTFLVGDGIGTKQMTYGQLRDSLIGNMGVAVIKCGHCGQWGARFCECRKCGAPIE